ncbi:retrotransposon Ty1-copia subclass [Lentinula edodes]|uniref:Retrotransposon Ty1-copia subclass n=1 Tax=Lentinula edodes TaxID=5353 RepID=A0A1Q3EAT8_LENED|nr:retrotransposon Ty1-copia subclass [Lentinula edodes]
MSFGNSPNIPRLPDEKQLVGEDNWRPFKRDITFAVQSKGLAGYLDGTIARPSKYPDPIYPPTQPTGTPLFSPTPCPEEWEIRDRLVAGAIVSNITDPVGLGIDETKRASEIWQELIKRFEKRDEQRIHLADTNLRQEKYDPDTTMEDHEKRMRNLLKKVHDLGGTATDAQFRRIVISSMPPGWKQDVRSVPGTSSADAFTYLHTLWYEKEEERKEEERDSKRVKALMAAHTNTTPQDSQSRTGGRTSITCHNCGKPGHIARKCWAKGGGMEGQGPRQGTPNKAKAGTSANATQPDNNDTSTPMATYVMSAQGNSKPSMSTSVPTHEPIADPTTRQVNPVLRGVSQWGAGERDVDKNVTTYQTVSKAECTICHGSTSLYSTPVPAIRTFIDSGASEHCWVQQSDFIEYTRVQGQGGSSAISGEAGRFQILGTGTIQFVTRIQDEERTIQLRGVKHTPSFGHNLISLSTLDSRGMRGEWGLGVMTVRAQNGQTILQGFGRNKMYEVEVLESGGTLANYSRARDRPADILTWHRRLGHIAIRRILRMSNRNLVDGLNITKRDVHGMCEDCLYGKATKRPFDEVLTHESEVLERVHMDLFGPSRTQSRGGAVYLMLCTDGRSSFRVPYYLTNKRKETGLKALHEYRVMAEKQTGKRLKIIRIDGGGELNNSLVDEYCRDNGILIEKVPHDSSAANGVAERSFRTVMEGTRTLLEEADLPYSFWGEASSTFIYINNFVPSARFPDVVPVEAWTQKRQDISHLRPFGCDCWATLPRRRTDGKLGRQAVKGKLLGYMGRRGYRVWIPESKKVEESHDVTFEEGTSHRTRAPEETNNEEYFGEETRTPVVDIQNSLDPRPNTPAQTTENPGNVDQTRARDEPTPMPAPLPPTSATEPIRRSERGQIPSRRHIESEEYRERERTAQERGESWTDDTPLALIAQHPYAFAATSGELWVPQSYKQEMRRPDLWTAPMETEFNTLENKECWELVLLPPGANLTGGRWTYAIKFNAAGNLLKRKARYVAQGYTQIQGQDYDKTYGGVARMESVRIVLAITAALKLSIFQVDFTAAFLNSPITHDVYMKQPEGFIRPGTEHLVCKLKKSIYGTMQGSHDWQATLAAGYKEDGYTTSRADPCIRYKRVGGEYTITSTYGDDICGGSSTKAGRDRAVADLGRRWEANEVTLAVLLGMTIRQHPETKAITISQKTYFQRMLTHFELDKVRRRNTPLPPNVKLKESPNPLPEDERQFMADKQYRAVVGSILWGQVCTRPDLAFAGSLLARYQLNPSRTHWDCVEWVAGYILNTLDYCITYQAPTANPGPGTGLQPYAYVDSDHAGCQDTSRSTSGYVFFMANAPVSWSSKRQATVALSTTESEYIGLSRATQQAVWLTSFLKEVDLGQEGPMDLLGDNFGSVSLTENSKRHALVKHIEMRHHYVREKVSSGEVNIKCIRSGENIADILTKALNGTTHSKLVSMLGIDRTE